MVVFMIRGTIYGDLGLCPSAPIPSSLTFRSRTLNALYERVRVHGDIDMHTAPRVRAVLDAIDGRRQNAYRALTLRQFIFSTALA